MSLLNKITVDQAKVRLAEIELENKKLELEAKKLELEAKKLELEAKKLEAEEKASQAELQAQKRLEITNVIMLLVYLLLLWLASSFEEINVILGRPLTCGFAILMAYFFSQRK